MPRQRLSATARRAQLIDVARHVFATKGLEGTSVEELALAAGVSKPLVYEHFGGKEGLYEAVVAEDTRRLDAILADAIQQGRSRLRIERTALALLDFAEHNEDAFRILVRDVGTTTIVEPLDVNPEDNAQPTLLAESVNRAAHVLAEAFVRNDLDPRFAALYAHAMVGAVAMVAQWWAVERLHADAVPPKDAVAAHVVNLLWNGLAGMESAPELHEEVQGEEATQGVRLGAGADADPAQRVRERK